MAHRPPYRVVAPASAAAENIDGLEVDCTVKTATGYAGEDNPFPLEVITINGKLIEVELAGAFYQMYLAAKSEGVNLVLGRTTHPRCSSQSSCARSASSSASSISR